MNKPVEAISELRKLVDSLTDSGQYALPWTDNIQQLLSYVTELEGELFFARKTNGPDHVTYHRVFRKMTNIDDDEYEEINRCTYINLLSDHIKTIPSETIKSGFGLKCYFRATEGWEFDYRFIDWSMEVEK